MAAVYPTKAMILMFEEMFQQYKNDKNMYYDHGINSIKVVHPEYPPMIFRFTSKVDWELITYKRDLEQFEALIELRKQLNIVQTELTNMKRRKK